MNKKKLFNIILGGSVGSSYDSDAQAYFTAAGITDSGEKTAWNNVVIALKAAGLYTGNIFYPFLGATATTQKFNAVNPANTDGANRMAFAGGATYTTSGYTPNGTTGYGNTFFVPSSFGSNVGSFGFVSLTSATGGYDMAAGNGAAANVTLCIARFSNGNAFFGIGTSDFVTTVVNGDGKGLYAASRLNVSTMEGYKNGLQIITNGTDSFVPFAATPLFLGANNSGAGVPGNFSSRTFAFAFIIPAGLTEAQHLTFYNIINDNFLTPLGRV